MSYFNDLSSGALGLASAASWGAGDFCGGLASRRAGAYQVVIGAHVVGVLAFAGLAVITGEQLHISIGLAWCAAAGVIGAAGLVALYRGLAGGHMGVVAPVAGVLNAMVPAVAGAWIDGPPGAITIAGFLLALVGVWLCSGSGAGGARPAELVLAVIAGLCFGAFIVLIAQGSGGGVFWPLVMARIASISALAMMALLGRRRVWPDRDAMPIIAMAGVLDGGGNAFLVMAAHAGRLDVAGVLSSLYPSGTVLLAWIVLREVVGRRQVVGLVVTLGAILAISAG